LVAMESEVERRASRLPSCWEQVPENFPQAKNGLRRCSHGLSIFKKENDPQVTR
jgi:hypothetical protein